jgi:xanthine dehydrogenase YagT iron-sulfur-binding subunit
METAWKRRSIFAHRFSTCCATTFSSPAPRRGATKGPAGRALCWSTASVSTRAWPLAVQYQGREIVTIEGLGSEGALHPLQRAFVEHDGFQCGYCTPGQICSAIAMIGEFERGVPSVLTADLATGAADLTHDELRERMSGNLCRCGAYNGIVDAIRTTFAVEAAE